MVEQLIEGNCGTSGGWRRWLRVSGTAGLWVALLVGIEWDGWMVGGAAGWDRVGRLDC